jgi:hypothetical protein
MSQNSQEDPNPALESLAQDLRELTPRWLPRADELRAFLERWDVAWNTHDIDLLETLVTEDITCRDPAMFGQIVENRAEFMAFIEIFFRAFPDVRFEDDGELYPSIESNGIALPWRMTGTFTGELAIWSKDPGAREAPRAPTGKTFDLKGVDLYRFRDGLLCDYSIVYDLLGFSAQVGLLG